MRRAVRLFSFVITSLMVAATSATANIYVSVSTNPTEFPPGSTVNVFVNASWDLHNQWCPYPITCWPESVRVDIWSSGGFSDVREHSLTQYSTSGWWSFSDTLPGQSMQATTYYATVTVYYRDYEVYAVYDDWGDGEGYTAPGRPTISGPNVLWWFNGQSPPNYSTSIILTTDAGSSAQWTITSGADKVTLSSDFGDSVTLTSTGTAFSQTGGDIRIIVSGWWGQASTEFAVTSRTPHRLEPTFSSYECNGTWGYVAQVHYRLRDQLDALLPSAVEANEQWTTPIQDDYHLTAGVNSNWRRGDEIPGVIQNSELVDSIAGENVNYPALPQPTCDGNSQGVQHWGQAFWIGSLATGAGKLVQTNTFQKLVGRAIHVDLISPPQ